MDLAQEQGQTAPSSTIEREDMHPVTDAGCALLAPPIDSACEWLAVLVLDAERLLQAADRAAGACPGRRRQRYRPPTPPRPCTATPTEDEPWERSPVTTIQPQTYRELAARRREDHRPAPPEPPKPAKPPKEPKPVKVPGRPGRPPKPRPA